MTTYECDLIHTVIEETFGIVVADILDYVFKSGIADLKEILARFHTLSPHLIKKVLQVLLHHHFITWKRIDNITYYIGCPDTVKCFLRAMHYLLTTREKYGQNREMLVDAVFKQGTATASQAIINAWCGISKNANRPRGGPPEIETLVKSFQFLVDNEYLLRCPTAKAANEGIVNDATNSTVNYRFSEEQELIESIKKETIARAQNKDYSFFPNNCPNMKHSDSEIHWRLNFKRFDIDLRDHVARLHICGIEYCKKAGPIFDAMLKIGYKKCDHWQLKIGPISLAELEKEIDIPYLTSYLELMKRHGSIDFISESQYQINMSAILLKICEGILNSNVKAQYGPKTHRVYRTVRVEGMLEKATIERLTMIGQQETNLAIGNLLHENIFQSKEFRKSGSCASTTSNVYTLYYVDLPAVIRNFHCFIYKAIFNMTVRLHQKYKENHVLLEKKKRLDLLSSLCDDVTELEEMISTEEWAQLKATNNSLNKYIASNVYTHLQAFVFEQCICYQKVENKAKYMLSISKK